MRIYDEENLVNDEDEDEMAGYTVEDANSVFNIAVSDSEEEETIATPIPQNEQTVILSEPSVGTLRDGAPLKLKFDGEACDVYSGSKKAGSLKPAYVKKLKSERGGQKAEVFYKKDIPPMIRIVFGNGEEIPKE